MRAPAWWWSFLVVGALFAPAAMACNTETGEREQRVHLEWDGKSVSAWSVDPGEVRRVELPNGFQLGVSVGPAAPGAYDGMRTAFRHVPELVKITLFDAGTQPPRRLTTTWGGANSIQGYGASGGADRVQELGDPGITMILLKPVCATAMSEK